MKNISKNAKLSTTYMNHCVWATVVTQLNEDGFKARDIMATTGHKSEASIRSYATKVPTKRRREMSDALASKILKSDNKIVQKQQKATVTSSEQDDHKDIQQASHYFDPMAINFELFPDLIEDDDIPNDELLKVITQIENENQSIMEKKDATDVPAIASPKNAKTINVANISNVNCTPLLPTMYFPNLTVTINYYQK